MILFINVFITENTLQFCYYDRGRLPKAASRVEIFKYMLASLSVVEWSSVHLFYQLDVMHQDRYGEIDEYMNGLFDSPSIHHTRIDRGKDWRRVIGELAETADGELVWFLCNDDHIFLDHETEYLYRLVSRLKELEQQHEFVSLMFSHWPETCGTYFEALSSRPEVLVEDHADYAVLLANPNLSIMVVNARVLEHWWLERDYGDRRLRRSDGLHSPEMLMMVPKRELVRHFDGYSHAGIDIDSCPPLFIPDGFFEREIRIAYCADRRLPGYVHVNPLLAHSSAVHPEGADLRCLMRDLPLFWRSRIAEVRVEREVDEATLAAHRNSNVLAAAGQRARGYDGDLTAALAPAFRQHHGRVPLAAAQPPGNRCETQFRKRNCSDIPIRHTLIFLDMAQNSRESLCDFAGGLRRHPGVEVIWLNLLLPNSETWMVDVAAADLFDAVIGCRFDGPMHKHVALNVGLAEARGEVVTVCEMTFRGMMVHESLLDEVRREFWPNGTDSPRPVVLSHAVWEAQAPAWPDQAEAAGDSNRRFQLLPSPYECCVSFRRSDAIEAGGFDEADGYLGVRGGAYQLCARLGEAGLERRRVETTGAVTYPAVPFPEPNVPASLYAQRNANP